MQFPSHLTEDLAQICGIHIGDGHLGFRDKKKEYLIQWTGSLRDDVEFFNQVVVPLWKRVFDLKVKCFSRKDNTYEMRVYSKKMFIYFRDFLELPVGKKTRIIRIPDVVKDTCKGSSVSPQMIACIRGIIDTDFYFVKDRTSLELGAWFASRDLVVDLKHYLDLLGFSATIRLDVEYYNKSSQKILTRHQLRIRKKADISRWFSLIRPANPKFYKRFLKFTGNHAPVV